MKKFLVGRARSLKYVFRGMYLLVSTEHALIAQLIIAAVFITMGFYFNISRMDWMMQVFSIGLVLTIESLNTAVEHLCDFVHPRFDDKIGLIKDIAAGAVGFAALFALIIVILIYYPYFL